MMFRGVHIKKRYIVAGVAALVLLVRCSGSHDEDDQAAPAHPITLSQYQQEGGYQDVTRNDPNVVQFSGQPQAAQPIIINQQPAQSDSGFWHGFFMAHAFHSLSGGHSAPTVVHRTVINKTYTNNTYRPAPVRTPAPAPVYAPTRASASANALRRVPTTSYSTPAPRYMTKANGYSRPSFSSTSSSYRSSSRSYSFRSRR